METASYVKMHAFGGSDMPSRRVFSSRELFRYVGCWRTMGWSCVSTHLPTVCGRLAQSEQTGRVDIGSLCSFTSK